MANVCNVCYYVTQPTLTFFRRINTPTEERIRTQKGMTNPKIRMYQPYEAHSGSSQQGAQLKDNLPSNV